MRVTGVAAGNRYVKAAGTAASAEQAFRVKLAMYQRGAHVVRAPTGDARVPKGLKPAVIGVTGLDNAPHIMRHADLGPPPGFVNGRPCSLFYGQVQGTSRRTSRRRFRSSRARSARTRTAATRRSSSEAPTAPATPA